ncbi:MAG: DUF86 domain-containing protein [Bacteroidetes bacterium]|nr:DUF86 domain-containing protein [Bacteroidota bacterium]
MISEKKIKILKEYFQEQSSVVLAFLFGSFAKGFQMQESDLDIAVYFDEKLSIKETMEEEEKVWFKITRIVGRSVDLVCLNIAPASLISNAIKTGVPLTIKDKKLYWKLYLEKSLEAEDFVKFAEDFLEIYRRAKSLSSEEKTELLKRIHFLDLELGEIEEFKKLTFNEYQSDKNKRRIIERWTENILNAIVDVAKIILASDKKRMPRSYEEALFNFAILVGFSEEEARKFSRFANLRNILAHEYLDILYSRIKNFIQEFPESYKKISDFLEEYLKKIKS